MEEFEKKCRELGRFCFEGEVTVTKVNLWLALTTCLMAGIVYGLRKAPFTHGIMIGSNNGNGNGNGNSCGPGQGKPGTVDKAGEGKPEEGGEACGAKERLCGRHECPGKQKKPGKDRGCRKSRHCRKH